MMKKALKSTAKTLASIHTAPTKLLQEQITLNDVIAKACMQLFTSNAAVAGATATGSSQSTSKSPMKNAASAHQSHMTLLSAGDKRGGIT
jgi:polyhydroxyalkanoate synthesis regulator protein